MSSTTQALEPATTPPAEGFEPRIVAFVCKWCTYAGADLAGTSRLTYDPNVRTIMLPCTGRIDTSFILRAFLQGADGVIVSGCHPGDCHYTAGNFRARRRWTLFRDLLDTMGFDLDRFELAWISAAEGAKWVKTISAFTQKIRSMGPYTAMRNVAENYLPLPVPAAGALPTVAGNGHEKPAVKSAELTAAAADSLGSGRIKALIGWTVGKTLGRLRPTWITAADQADGLVMPADDGNLARLLKNPRLKSFSPVGIVARQAELLSINVLRQEAQIDPSLIVVFAVDDHGKFIGEMDLATATTQLVNDKMANMPADQLVGFSSQTVKLLDELSAKTPQERWAFWAEVSARCLKCYACRGSCPMCNCDQCMADKNQPQWLPTAADGAGDFAWHLTRAFHLAGRCVGCGACEAACPVDIPLNVLGAAMARSALKNFGHRAGENPADQPVQACYKPDDKEDFIL